MKFVLYYIQKKSFLIYIDIYFYHLYCGLFITFSFDSVLLIFLECNLSFFQRKLLQGQKAFALLVIFVKV